MAEDVERAYLQAYLLVPEVGIHGVDSRDVGYDKGKYGSGYQRISA